jgi:NAD(P)-dependent dehydrogenase (short-subunit alcohol dehydrogenase family)
MRRKIVITGAAGGMGRACARLLGAGCDLILTDVAAEPLERFTGELRTDGYAILGAHAGDLGSEAVLSALTADIGADGPFALIHTAGVSPSQADWRTIISVNLASTERLLRAVEPLLRPQCAAVLVASTAGHAPIASPEIDKLIDAPLAEGFVDGVGAMLDGMLGPDSPFAGGMAYVFSKRGVLRICEKRCAAWAERGARIVSISPGTIATPMGRLEMEKNPAALAATEAAPMRRPGNPMDIAFAARFLISEEAGFITGTDLRVDGGSVGAQKAAMG